MTETFLKFASERLVAEQSIFIDSPAIETPLLLLRNKQSVAQQLNQKGEGDHAVWYHAARSPISNVVVYACDTDIWMTGFALAELGNLHGKSVLVELRQSEQYVNVTECNNVLHAIHPCKSSDSLHHVYWQCMFSVALTMSVRFLESTIKLLFVHFVEMPSLFVAMRVLSSLENQQASRHDLSLYLYLPVPNSLHAFIMIVTKQFWEAKQHMSCPFQSRSLQYLMKCP